MHKIKSIEIIGFRGQRKAIRLDLHENANFLIGRNGTGKTTLINLINAALTIDLPTLRDVAFASIAVKFKSPGSRVVPTVTIQKQAEETVLDIKYLIQDSSAADPEEYSLLRPRRKTLISPDGTRRNVLVNQTFSRRSLRDRLSGIYKTTWLSLQRRADTIDEPDEFDIDEEGTDVDHKLDQVLTDLVKYFSRLDRLVAEETQSFQKRWFLSFLASDSQFLASEANKLDFDAERLALVSIFDKFGMDEENYAAQLDKHFSLSDRARTTLKEKQRLTMKDYLALYDAFKLHSLVEQWQILQETQKETYLPRTEFVTVASSMLFRKNITIDRSNQVIVVSDKESRIPAHSLSSGEKQLLIFLSETLLQEQSTYIFMADEPELSLHVEWQEELVPSLLKINPAAQVIFATHSPDIVNVYQENVFEMEELTD